MIPDSKDLADYIANKYRGAKKIVEVGIGTEDTTYSYLRKKHHLNVIAVDLISSDDALFDDIFEPNIGIYLGAELIYSIRPNPELIPCLQRLAAEVGAALVIRPLSTDSCHKPQGMKLINHGKAVIWEEQR